MDELNLIRKIAWSYTRGTSLEFDDLFSEAYLAYLENTGRYDPKRGSRSTFIWNVVTSRLNNILKVARKAPLPEACLDFVELDQYEAQNVPGPEQAYLAKERWRELVMRMSPEARIICSILANGDTYLQTDKPRQCRGAIVRELRSRGWSHSRIWATIAELKELLA